MSTLHITEPTFDFNTINPLSKLLTAGDNINVGDEYHTSIGDMSGQEIIDVSTKFNTINFVPNGFDTSSDTFTESKILINVLRHRVNVTGDSVEPINDFLTMDVRTRPNAPVLWVFGCSHSHGVGLKPNEKTFGQILANAIDLPLMQVTRPGSSLSWSFRHLINADIRPKDWVIWQLTVPSRVSIFNGVDVDEVLLSVTRDRSLLDVNTDDQIFFNQISMVTAGIRHLRAIQSQFLFLDITSKNSYFYKYILEYSKHPEYCYQLNSSIDLGTDNLHVGPLSHNAIALSLASRVQYRND